MRTEDQLYTNNGNAEDSMTANSHDAGSDNEIDADNVLAVDNGDNDNDNDNAKSPEKEKPVESMASSSTSSSMHDLIAQTLGDDTTNQNVSENGNNPDKLNLYKELLQLQGDDAPEEQLDKEKIEEKVSNEISNEASLAMPKIHYEPLDAILPLDVPTTTTAQNDKKNKNDEKNANITNTSVWNLFLSNNKTFINNRLKLIPHVVKSPWYLPIPNKPVLLGKYSPSHIYRGENYLEIDIEADSTKLAQKVVKGAHGVSKQIIVDIVWVIEGCQSSELPERCLGGVRLFNVDVTKVTPLQRNPNLIEVTESDEEDAADSKK